MKNTSGVQTDAHFITYVLIVLVALQIPYYDEGGLKRTCVGVSILYVIVTIVQGIKGITVLNVDTICSVVGVKRMQNLHLLVHLFVRFTYI